MRKYVTPIFTTLGILLWVVAIVGCAIRQPEMTLIGEVGAATAIAIIAINLGRD